MGESEGKALNLEMLTMLCGRGDCPTVYRSEDGRIFVQGTDSTGSVDGVPAHERVVEVPQDLILEAARAISQDPAGS